jgi:hypothetical protein
MFEIINFPKFDPRNLKDSCPEVHRAEILQIFRAKFWKIDDFKNCFQDLPTFNRLKNLFVCLFKGWTTPLPHKWNPYLVEKLMHSVLNMN